MHLQPAHHVSQRVGHQNSGCTSRTRHKSGYSSVTTLLGDASFITLITHGFVSGFQSASYELTRAFPLPQTHNPPTWHRLYCGNINGTNSPCVHRGVKGADRGQSSTLLRPLFTLSFIEGINKALGCGATHPPPPPSQRLLVALITA